MTNILMRAGMSPLDTLDASHMIVNNSIGGNVGNLVYQYSVFRTLMTKDTIITPDYYDFDPKYADEINEKYDYFVIPLADAFREQFVPSLRKYTKLIKKLKIPVVVIGVGLRAPFEPKLNEGFPFDSDVKAFVKAVLEKSSMIGLRGEITSEYLTKLGFREGTDHTVIGCPSMYTFGRDLQIRDTTITKNSLVSVNSSRHSPKNVLDFITRSMEEYPNHYFIPQWLKELRMTYIGTPSIAKSSSNYPVKMSDPAYIDDRVRYFLNVPTWLDFLKQADLSFGARLHGNITATIAGTPSILIPKDARMRELAEYHHLTHVMADQITAKTKLSDLVKKVDFQQPVKPHGKNFDHYIDFLNKNGLNHIYKEMLYPPIIPLEEKIAKIRLEDPISPITGVSAEEIVRRLETFYPLEEKYKKLNKDSKERSISDYQKALKRKAATMVSKTSSILSLK